MQERQSDQQPVATPTLSWPPSGAIPINEFTTEGYMSCAFPTLFPTGDADSRNTLNRKMSCPKVDMTPAATCRSVNHTLTHREANTLELALSRSRSPHNAPHSPSYVIYLSICDRHCTSKIAINISIFHLGSYTRRARIVPRRGAVGPTHFRSHCPRPPGAEL